MEMKTLFLVLKCITKDSDLNGFEWMLFVGYMGQFNKNVCDSESIDDRNWNVEA